MDPSVGADQSEILETFRNDDRVEPFQLVALGRKLLQTLVDIKKSSLARIESSLLRISSKRTDFARFWEASN